MTIQNLEVIHVSTNGLIKIPSSMRTELEISDGDNLLVVQQDGKIILKKITDADLKGIEKSLIN